MQDKTKALILVLFLPPLIAEILSGNMPVLNFLNPVSLLVLVLIYGCGSLLIREAKVRWKAQWSIGFLAVAYGLYEEGLVTQAYFNPNWFEQGALSGNWMVFGVQWGWTILLLVFHASISTLLPIYLISKVWPETEGKPLVGNKGVILALLGTVFALSLWMSTLVLGGAETKQAFFAEPWLLIATFVAMVVLAFLTFHFRKSRLSFSKGLLSPVKIALLAFFFQGANTLFPHILAGAGFRARIGIPLQLVVVAGFLWFAATQLLNKKTELKHIVAYAFGSIMLFIFFSGILGIYGRTDLLIVSPIAFVLLLLWRRKALKS